MAEAPPVEKIATRLYVDHTLSEGTVVGLDHARSHYLRSVLRLQPGARVALFNGRDGEWGTRLDALGRGWASLVVETQRRPQAPEPDCWLLFAPIKRGRIDFLAQKATELGVSRLWPVFSKRTAVERVNRERLIANAIEAAEQCERLTVPEVAPDMALPKALADWPAERRLFLCAESGDAVPMAEAFAAWRAGQSRPVVASPESPIGGVAGAVSGASGVLIGPEGGFAPGELDACLELPFVTAIGLGPRLLRSDTAALAALSCLQAIAGDGGERPPFRGGA